MFTYKNQRRYNRERALRSLACVPTREPTPLGRRNGHENPKPAARTAAPPAIGTAKDRQSTPSAEYLGDLYTETGQTLRGSFSAGWLAGRPAAAAAAVNRLHRCQIVQVNTHVKALAKGQVVQVGSTTQTTHTGHTGHTGYTRQTAQTVQTAQFVYYFFKD